MATRNFLISDEEYQMLLRRDLFTFVDRAFTELNPGQELSPALHLAVMCSKLEAALSGRGPRRLIVTLPPRSLKSITFSVAGVAWILGHFPTLNIICASYSQDLAEKHARDTRLIMNSSFYKKAFPATVLSTQKQAVNDFMTTQQGFRMATSVGGTLTGRGADVIIIDDPLKPDEALSETRRGGANDWYDNTLLSRLNSKEKGIIIIVQQRLHQDDLVGHLVERGEVWDTLNFPAIATENERIPYETLLGPRIYSRNVGEVLDPARESLQTLEGIRQVIGSYNFQAQYQQDPAPVGGAIVKAEWLHYYEAGAPLPGFTTILQSWDTANKSGELNDFSVCTTWGVYDGRFYLLHVYRERLNYPELRRKIPEHMRLHRATVVIIEDKASGTQLIADLRTAGHRAVKPADALPHADKIMRLHAQTAVFEAARVLLPSQGSWLAEYRRELLTFPGTRYDDQIDSTTQALFYLEQHKGLDVWRRLGRD